jgi:hypothetical protein
MAKTPDLFRKRMDDDVGLRSKRRMLTIASTILIGLQVTGASIIEVNTLVVKLNFMHPQGITIFLFFTIIFLGIRYYNYAKEYQDELFERWSSRMLREPMFSSVEFHSDDWTGVIPELAPKSILANIPTHDESFNFSSHYKCGVFSRFIQFYWRDQNDEYEESVNIRKSDKIDFSTFLTILKCEMKYQVSSWLTHRENLDIFGPYLLATTAIFSIFFYDQIRPLLEWIPE